MRAEGGGDGRHFAGFERRGPRDESRVGCPGSPTAGAPAACALNMARNIGQPSL